MNMEDTVIERVLSRCKVCDIKSLLKVWDFLERVELENLDMKNSKRMLIYQVQQLCKDKDNVKSKAAELDLLFMQSYHPRCKWNIFKVTTEKGQTNSDMAKSLPKLKKSLKSQLSLFFHPNSSVVANISHGALWFRIYIVDEPAARTPTKYQKNNVIFLVQKPATPYLALTNIKPKHQNYVLQCIQEMLSCKKLVNIHLEGYHLDSLFQLSAQKDAKGGLLEYNDSAHQLAPFADYQPRKRKAPPMEEDENVATEEEDRLKKRTRTLEEDYGDHEQPLLEKLQYKVHVGFRGSEVISMPTDKPFRCKVVFEGPSVLEGIRSLCEHGMADMPLPSHLRKVHTLGKNQFVILDKTSHKSPS